MYERLFTIIKKSNYCLTKMTNQC